MYINYRKFVNAYVSERGACEERVNVESIAMRNHRIDNG
jgi:hypothetical protein